MSNQSAGAVVMIRPEQFGSNPATLATNRFQRAREPEPALDAAEDVTEDVAGRAREEFDRLRAKLAAHGVDVHVFSGSSERSLPDEVFPNNWLSLHANGTAVLYPLMAETRRPERRLDVLETLQDTFGYRLDRVIDLTPFERVSKYLEGTGSVVFDHLHRQAYACRSARTHASLVETLARALDYEAFVFTAVDRGGFPIYHTNVLLSIGTGFALVCAGAIQDARARKRLVETLEATGRDVIALSFAQMEAFAGNALELRGRDGVVIALSSRARASLDGPALRRLAAHGSLVDADVETIETCGGGSVRCMLAEVFLPVALRPGFTIRTTA